MSGKLAASIVGSNEEQGATLVFLGKSC